MVLQWLYLCYLTERLGHPCLWLCSAVPGDLLGRVESAFLGSYLSLPFLTSNLLLPILFPSSQPHAATHARAHRNTRMPPHVRTHSPPRVTTFMWASLSAKSSWEVIRLKMCYLLPNATFFIKPASDSPSNNISLGLSSANIYLPFQWPQLSTSYVVGI